MTDAQYAGALKFPSSVVSGSPSGGIPAWVTGTVYPVNTLVSNSGTDYICNTANTAGATFAADQAKWTAVGPASVAALPWATSSLGGDVCIGDSIMQGTSALSITQQNTALLPSGTKYNAGVNPGSMFDMATILSAGKIRWRGNLGISGQNSTQILARIGDVIALKPQRCWILCGVNDIIFNPTTARGTGSTDTWSPQNEATFRSNIRAIVAALIAAQIEPIICKLTPSPFPNVQTYSITIGTFNGQQIKVNPLIWVNRYNAWLHQYCAANGLLLVDTHDPVGDVTAASSGCYVPSMTTDGTHPSLLGAKTLGQAMADALALSDRRPARAWLSARSGTYDNPITEVQNSCFALPTAGAAGPSWAPSGWVGPSATGIVSSQVADASGPTDSEMWHLERQGGAGVGVAANGISAQFVNYTTPAASDRMLLAFRFNSSLVGGTGRALMRITHAQEADPGGYFYPLYNLTEDLTNALLTCEFHAAGGTPPSVDFVGVDASGVGSFEIAQFTVLNLTQLGL